MNYFYTDLNYQPQGPASPEQLQVLAGSGVVNSETLIVPIGGQQWIPITTILPSLPPPAGTNPLAICSLVFSVVGLASCALITSTPGIICGHIALSRIAKHPHLGGKGMAKAGLIIGYIGIALCLIYIALVIAVITLDPPK